MADKPIPFSAPMIQALLDGRKTQTRRMLKVQPESGVKFQGVERDGQWLFSNGPYFEKIRPPSAKGDRLWVREAHYAYGHWITTDELTRTGKPKRKFVRDLLSDAVFDPSKIDIVAGRPERQYGWYARLGRYMFRADSRLTLTVTDVRVQRLQDISEAGAIAEGIEPTESPSHPFGRWKDYSGEVDYFVAPQNSFHSLWNSINGPDAWGENPWVAAYTFTIRKGNIDGVPG